ncbi:uncharacterized protein UDID_19498 [Ustilago sp. UG-2017a]|nr:uncharacterized protein UDID_19498 [Ustilago sp. UG-2017a]
MTLYLFTVVLAPLLLLSLQRVPAVSSASQESSTRPLILIALSRLSFLSRADSIDTAPPPSVLLAGFSYTALLPSTVLLLLLSSSPVSLTQPSFLRPVTAPLSCVPLSGHQLHAPELGPLLAALGPAPPRKLVVCPCLLLISAESVIGSLLLPILAESAIPFLISPILV